MEGSRVVVRHLGHLLRQVQGSGHMWWNVVITQSLGWIPANHFPREWTILVSLRELQFP